MKMKLTIRVHADDRVEVKVKGLSNQDRSRPKGKKLCEKITKNLENDLGLVVNREYQNEGEQDQIIEFSQEDLLRIGGD